MDPQEGLVTPMPVAQCCKVGASVTAGGTGTTLCL
jgi:hypothetical protein